MEITNQLKSNFGLIVLSISIIIGSLILAEKEVVYPGAPALRVNESKISLTGEIAAREIP